MSSRHHSHRIRHEILVGDESSAQMPGSDRVAGSHCNTFTAQYLVYGCKVCGLLIHETSVAPYLCHADSAKREFDLGPINVGQARHTGTPAEGIVPFKVRAHQCADDTHAVPITFAPAQAMP